MFKRALPAALATALFAVAAVAQPAAPPFRVRGTIASVEGETTTVATREGPTVAIVLHDPLTVAAVKKFELADIAAGSYVGIATRNGANGEQQAIEVLVFPDAMRGTGEGHYPWDLEPGSMMTNGTVTGTVQGTSGRDLMLSFKGDSTKIVVPPGVPVVTFVSAGRADLKPGVPVMFGATKNADGKLVGSRVTVGRDGIAPPM
jgi:hypothetical protein